MSNTITKSFGDFPAAHRQPFHGGHCAQIHGHNWEFEVSIYCLDNQLDGNGFVFDFGAFGPVKEWLRQNFDHTLLLQSNDPKLDDLLETIGMDGTLGVARIIVLPSVSCEGLARMFFEYMERFIKEQVGDRQVNVVSVTVREDGKNSATYTY